jgi:uncharacterized protein YecT (DUF1311 family)
MESSSIARGRQRRFVGKRRFVAGFLGATAPGTVIASLALSGIAAAQAAKPSFDCAKAVSPAEKAICADPALASADATIAQNYAAALDRLGATARKALQKDEQDFVSYRDTIAQFNDDIPKEKQNFDLGEFMRDRVAFLANIKKPTAGLVGLWTNVRGEVEIKPAGRGKMEVSAEVANPVTGGGECDVDDTVKAAGQLKLVESDDDDKPTGFVYYFYRGGDALIAEETGEARGDAVGPASCGANGHVDGVFFLTAQRRLLRPHRRRRRRQILPRRPRSRHRNNADDGATS